MRLALFGATGMIGRPIVDEALSRGHAVTAVVRHPVHLALAHPGLTVAVGDPLDPASVAALVRGHDAVVSAVGPGNATANDPALAQQVIDVAHALLAGLREAGVGRLVVVGGAGSLKNADGMDLVDTGKVSDYYRPASLAHRAALHVYRAAELDWTVICPPTLIEPGPRESPVRVGGGRLLVDAAGRSRITTADFAVAVLDELEHPQRSRQQMTVAY